MKYELERWLLDKMIEEKAEDQFAVIEMTIGTNTNIRLEYWLKNVKSKQFHLDVDDIKSVKVKNSGVNFELEPKDYKEFLQRMIKKEKI